MAFGLVSKLIFLAVFMAVLAPAMLATGYLDPAPSESIFIAVFVVSAIAAFVLASMIEKWLRRRFFF